jgi:mRNA-degrading endonuclease YafQ of YafQ-DinJ toxin-antitoxin module
LAGVLSVARRTKRIRQKSLQIFQIDPFAPSLRVHKIHSLSALYKRVIYSVAIENDLRAVFYLEEDTVFTVDLGTHDIYG